MFDLVLLARVIVSWIALRGGSSSVHGPAPLGYELLFDVTEPVLRPLRRIVPPAGLFDLSVVMAFIIIFVLRTAICG